MSDAPETPPRPSGRNPAHEAGAEPDTWSPPRSEAYKPDGIESVRVISGSEQVSPREGNGTEPVDGAVAAEGTRAPDGDAAGDEGNGDIGNGEVGEEQDGTPARRAVRAAIEWATVIGGALLVAFVVKTFLVQAFWIPSPSMAETLVKGDRVLVNKLADDVGDIHRGDVIVFKKPENGGANREGQIEDLIKRVIGLPGDVVESRDGAVYVNDRRLDEPYLDPGLRTEVNGQDMEPVTVPEGHIFVMGDNRVNSTDSRAFGPVDGEQIVGRAFVRVWPLDHIGTL